MSALFALSCLFVSLAVGQDIPEQIHISFGEDHRTIVVMWSSRDLRHGYVKYGDVKDNLTITSNTSEVAQLPVESSAQAFKFIHRVELKDLTLGSEYYYRVYLTSLNHSDATGSDVYKFRTLQEQTLQRTRPANYIVYGDLGVEPDIPTYRLVETMVTSYDVTAIWHVGDIAYNLDDDQGKVGDDFMRLVQPFAANIPYMTSPGNHEIPGNFSHYRTRFSMPGASWPMPLNRLWYSYDIGLVHFISYSSEVYFTFNEDYVCEQFDWLLEDLKRANRNRDAVPWIIAMGHRPMYCSNNNADDCTNRFRHRWVRYGLEDLFHAQGVDLIIEAHEHSYERLWPVYRGEVTSRNYTDPRASVHVVTGAAGNKYPVDFMTRNAGNDWSAFSADATSKYTIGFLVVENRTHLQFQQIELTNSSVLDDFWIVQTKHGHFIEGVTCSGSDNHPSCICPSPVRYKKYYTVAVVVGSICSVAIIGITILLMRRCYRKQRRLRIPISIQLEEEHLLHEKRLKPATGILNDSASDSDMGEI